MPDKAAPKQAGLDAHNPYLALAEIAHTESRHSLHVTCTCTNKYACPEKCTAKFAFCIFSCTFPHTLTVEARGQKSCNIHVTLYNPAGSGLPTAIPGTSYCLSPLQRQANGKR
mmetsp:Transcript_108613/g.187887  ORF Transcript_108613/g.187887 Transcript_108613/m.187887 type:complete len:113 (+) Transcript_108613:25-363(+)